MSPKPSPSHPAPASASAPSAAPTPAPAPTRPPLAEHIVHLYGDLLFDLANAILSAPGSAQLALRSILKEARRGSSPYAYSALERAWVLQIACSHLLEMAAKYGHRLTSSEQIQLDAAQNAASRLKEFESYFHRLPPEDQLLLLLRDKYGLPYPEIAMALQTPEATLKLRRTHSLRALEGWLWEQR